MVWLNRFEGRQLPLLGRIAEASFALYLIHPIVLTFLQECSTFSFNHGYKAATAVFNVLYHPLGLSIYFLLILGFCYAVALSARKLFGSKSKLVIGW